MFFLVKRHTDEVWYRVISSQARTQDFFKGGGGGGGFNIYKSGRKIRNDSASRWISGGGGGGGGG